MTEPPSTYILLYNKKEFVNRIDGNFNDAKSKREERFFLKETMRNI